MWAGCATVSLLVESAQAVLLPDRTPSVTDVVTNSTGAALGILVHHLLQRWARAADDEP